MNMKSSDLLNLMILIFVFILTYLFFIAPYYFIRREAFKFMVSFILPWDLLIFRLKNDADRINAIENVIVEKKFFFQR